MDRQERIDFILDHHDKPRHRGVLPAADAVYSGGNPGCGDIVTFYLKVDGDGRIEDISFEGEGCTISQAASSIVTEMFHGKTLADVEALCACKAAAEGFKTRCHQSNREYELIDWIHAARGAMAGIVINPAAFTHTSVALLDALNAYEGPVVEVHVSNVHKREPFRHHSFVSQRADAVIAGAGIQGYGFAVERVAQLVRISRETK